jgi:hypothetical protein
MDTNVSEEPAASTFRVEEDGGLAFIQNAEIYQITDVRTSHLTNFNKLCVHFHSIDMGIRSYYPMGCDAV